MASFDVEFFVTYKKGTLDPQGVALEKAAKALGFKTVRNVRVGKYITMQIEGKSEDEVSKKLNEMAKKFLVNPVIEDYSFKVKRG